MIQSYNDIVSSKRNLHCDNDNVCHGVSSKDRQIDGEAMAVCRKMGNEGDEVAFKFYCKAFYHLAPVQIWNNVELALAKGRDPAKYLSWLLNRELKKVNP